MASRENARGARTIILKVKTKEFTSFTRSLTLSTSLNSCEGFADMAVRLCERVGLGPDQLYRLVGVGLSNFRGEDERREQHALIHSASECLKDAADSEL